LTCIFCIYWQQSQVILKLFLSEGMPVLEALLKFKCDDVTSMLKMLQVTTRFLHTLCISTKVTSLTFKNRVSYIGRAYRYPPDVAFYIFFSATINTEYFKHAAHSPFFTSKCRLFHNAAFFCSCIIHILQGVLKFKCKI